MAEPAKDIMVEDNTPKKTMFMNRPYSQEEREKETTKTIIKMMTTMVVNLP